MITLLKLCPYTGDVTVPSPNHDARRAPTIEGIVLHATADQGDEAVSLSWLRSPKSGVSCHLFVSRTGRVLRLVGDRQRAWHAGLSWWRGTSDVNSITLGIEIANRNDGEPYTDAQYRRVAAIVAHYCAQGLSPEDVVSHESISEGRKNDPLGWDWDHFRSMVNDQLAPELPISETQVIAGAKPILRSRTVWLNSFTVLAAGALLTGDTLDMAGKIGIHLPPNLTKWALLVVGVVNIILRIFTTRPIIHSPRPDPTDVPPKGLNVELSRS